MEALREAMRKWVAGVSVVTARHANLMHGMTVNSLSSVSMDPPRIVVTLSNQTRTYRLVTESGMFGVSILSAEQQVLSDRFAGRISDDENRFDGLIVDYLYENIPVIHGSLAQLACRVVHVYEMPLSSLFVAEVIDARVDSATSALVYANRHYQSLEL